VAPRTRRRAPYDPSKAHDRRATDLLRNAQVSPIEVDDPLEIGGKLIVMRSTRNDPLANLHARHSIGEAQYHGGRAFQHDFEAIEHGAKAVDPSQPYVDCSVVARGVSDSFSKALVRLNLANKELGQNGAALTRDVLITGLSIAQVAEKRGVGGEIELKYLGRRFRECLDCLALVYGFAMEKRS
jgi:hypothetical protein